MNETERGLGPLQETVHLGRPEEATKIAWSHADGDDEVGAVVFDPWPEDDDAVDGRLSWGETFRTASTILALSIAVLAVLATTALVAWANWPNQGGSTSVALPPQTSTEPSREPNIPGRAPNAPSAVAEAPPAPVVAPQQQPPAPMVPQQLPAPAPGGDPLFLDEMRRAGYPITDTAVAVAAAPKGCDYLATGHSPREAADLAMRNNPAISPEEASAYVEATIDAYCPQYRGELR